MTAFVRAFVFCDGCHQPLDNSTVPSARTVGEARREAKRDGWVCKRGGRDLCEYCAQQAQDA
ncbi:hypothetical protein [Streptomyces sp. NPDC007991]|uniref:hypothetical protein n=1 Tax=Streptomyces sp. NPDC007991 TaxID=3364803 RepID=UPI0036E50919